MADPRRRRSVSQAFLLELLGRQLAQWRAPEGEPVALVDLGGGTGFMASVLASRGYRVTVIDPSPDALASLERRAAEAGLQDRLRGVQGDAGDLVRIVGRGTVDGILCHRVLDVVDDPAAALAAAAEALRPGGVLSLVVAQRPAAVLAQALAGHFEQARRTASDRTRFDYDRVLSLVEAAGFGILATHGLGAVSEHVAESLVDAEPGAHAQLLALEAEISQDPAFRAVAPSLHVLAGRTDGEP